MTTMRFRAGSYHRPGLSSHDGRHGAALWATAGVRLRVGRVPLHGVAVRAAQISSALVRRGTEGCARDAVLVVRRNRFRGAVPDASERRRQPESAGARQEAGHHVAGEGLRAVRVHGVRRVRDGRSVPSAHVAAVRRGAGQRVSAPAARPS